MLRCLEPGQALRLEEVEAMLEDLKMQMRGTLRCRAAAAENEAGDAGQPTPSWDVPGSQFFHLHPDNLRVAEVEALQQEYAALFVRAAA